MKEVELPAEQAVVAPLRLLDPLEVLRELVLREEGGAVDAGQPLACGVAAPVGARERREREGLDRRGGLQVRSTAEVDPAVLGVERHLLALGQALRELHLERLVVCAEARDRILTRRHRPLDRVRATLEDAPHLHLDAREIRLDRRLGEREVVVEAVGDRGPDRHLRAGKDALHGLGQHVRRRVAQHRQSLVVADPHDLERGTVPQRQAQVLEHAVDLDGRRRGGQAIADRAGGIEAGCSVVELEASTVRQRHVHRSSLWAGLRRAQRPPPSG